jgi:hypothetical protein
MSTPTAQLVGTPSWWLKPSRGEQIKYPDKAWDAGIEGDVVLDLCLDRGEVVRTENISGHPELTAPVLKAAEGWRFDRLNLQRLHGIFRFKKSPTLRDFHEQGVLVITRDYEPPHLSNGELWRIHNHLPMRNMIDPSPITGFWLCVGATGKLDSAEPAFASDRAAAAGLLEGLQRARFKPAKLRGDPIASCVQWVVNVWAP